MQPLLEAVEVFIDARIQPILLVFELSSLDGAVMVFERIVERLSSGKNVNAVLNESR